MYLIVVMKSMVPAKVKISGGKVSFGGREEVRKVRKGPHTKSNKVTKIATMGE